MKIKSILNLTMALIAFVVTAKGQSLQDALKLTENEQYDAATEIYKKLIAADPNNATNYYYFGENYLLSDNPDSALMMYQEGQKKDPQNPLIKIGIAKYKLDKVNTAEAKRLMEMEKQNFENEVKKAASSGTGEVKAQMGEAIQRYTEAQAGVGEAKAAIAEAVASTQGKNAQVLIEAADALIHFKNKDFEAAKGYLDKAYALQPKNADILILYGDLYAEQNNGSLSADYYNKALALNPSSARSIVNKGRLYRRSTNYEGAAEEFKRAISIDNNYAPAHRELGDVYYRLNKLDMAKAEYKKYLELSKNNCAARIKYASFLYISKDFPGVISELDQLKNCDPNNIAMLRLRAYSAYELKDSIRSLASMKDLFGRIKEDRLVSQDYEYYGKSLIANAQDSIGVYNLQKAYELDNTRCDLLNDIYNSYKKQKRFAEAAAARAEKINHCKGLTTRDYMEYGIMLMYAGEYKSSDSVFAKVNTMVPNYASGWYYRGRVNDMVDTLKDKKGLAKPHYEKFIEVYNADTSTSKLASYKDFLIPAYRYLGAWAFKFENNSSKAKEYYKKILDLDPNDENANEVIRGFEFEQDQRNKKKP